jgi:Fur family transcriptional regulator, ferric uptake regulator
MTQPEASGQSSATQVVRPRRAKVDERLGVFHALLKGRGLKSTGQRDNIVRVFFELGWHLSAEELYAEVKKKNPQVGYATIYRTLRLLKECELVEERRFEDGHIRYEAVGGRHHDHFICERCGKIIEFEDENLERMQHRVARNLGVALSHHKIELYGLCADCAAKARTMLPNPEG